MRVSCGLIDATADHDSGEEAQDEAGRSREEIEYELLVGQLVLQAQPQDPHPERRRKGAGAALLLGLVCVFPCGHATSISRGKHAIDNSQWHAKVRG